MGGDSWARGEAGVMPMRADVVLDLAIGSGPYVSPGEMRRMGRSFWRTSRHFHIQGGRDATNGWENFSESFKLDGIESARYVSWYYTMLRQLYLCGCTLDDMAKFVAVDPVKYLAAAFDDATSWVQGVSATVEKNPLAQDSTRGAPLTAHLNIEQRALARRLRSQGWSLRAIAKQVGCGHAGIEVMLRGQSREARPIEWVPRRGALCIEEREEILRGLSRGSSLSAIARQLGRCTSTVSREVGANGGRDGYRVWPAHQRAHAGRR